MKISAFTKTYGGRTVLDMPETELEPGASYAVIGANGSGKSTLIQHFNGRRKDCHIRNNGRLHAAEKLCVPNDGYAQFARRRK